MSIFRPYIEKLGTVRKDRHALLSVVVCALLLALIIYSFYVRVRMYMLGLSFWLDEAMLAENIVDRTMGGMLTPPLANYQTAPVLYLVFVKIISLIFGVSESALRSFSFVSFIGMLIVQALMLRKVFRVRIELVFFSLALSSTFLYYMQYSNELKPYMGDAAFVLLTLFVYYAYREGLLGRGVRGAALLGLILSACMLFSTPAAFAAGAVIVVEFFACLTRKNRKAALLIVLSGFIFLFAFLLNYLLWLRPIATADFMVSYWIDQQFDLKLYSIEAWRHNFWVIWLMLTPIHSMAKILLPFAAIGFVFSLIKKNIYTVVVGVFFILLLAASAIGKYPIQDRLWLFVHVILFIYAFVFLNFIASYPFFGSKGVKHGSTGNVDIDGITDAPGTLETSGRATGAGVKSGVAKTIRTAIALALAILLLIPNLTFPAYGKGEGWTLWAGNQANPLIEYVRENIRDGEILYGYASAKHIIKYKNGYHTMRIGDVASDNLFFGAEDGYKQEMEQIAETGDTYLLFYHAYYPYKWDWRVPYIIIELRERGYMDFIMDENHTHLFWFANDISKVKASATLEAVDIITNNDELSATLSIKNTGASILSPQSPFGPRDQEDLNERDYYGQLQIVIARADEGVPAGEWKVIGFVDEPISPGQSVEVRVEEIKLASGEYVIDLIAFGQYSFSEIGMAPVRVTMPE